MHRVFCISNFTVCGGLQNYRSLLTVCAMSAFTRTYSIHLDVLLPVLTINKRIVYGRTTFFNYLMPGCVGLKNAITFLLCMFCIRHSHVVYKKKTKDGRSSFSIMFVYLYRLIINQINLTKWRQTLSF